MLLRFGLLLLILVTVPVLLPVAMVACGPVLLSRILYDCLYPYGCLKKAGVILLGSIIGIIADPFVWIGCIFYFVPQGIIKGYRWIRERREDNRRRKMFLQERLLDEEIF